MTVWFKFRKILRYSIVISVSSLQQLNDWYSEHKFNVFSGLKSDTFAENWHLTCNFSNIYSWLARKLATIEIGLVSRSQKRPFWEATL